LFVLPSGDDDYSCWGFDNAIKETKLLAQKTHQPVLVYEPGDLAVLAEHRRLVALYAASPRSKETFFDADTPLKVQQVLENARKRKIRCRIWLGDNATGLAWLEEHEVVGHIGRSQGPLRVPLMITREREISGGTISTASVIRVDFQGTVRPAYQHEQFHLPKLDIRHAPTHVPEYPYEVLADGEVHARFGDMGKAAAWVAFMHGDVFEL